MYAFMYERRITPAMIVKLQLEYYLVLQGSNWQIC